MDFLIARVLHSHTVRFCEILLFCTYNDNVYCHADSGKYCARLKQRTKPNFKYIDEQSKPGFSQYHCTITYRKDGSYNSMKSGYCPSKESAEEKAAKKILLHENWL